MQRQILLLWDHQQRLTWSSVKRFARDLWPHSVAMATMRCSVTAKGAMSRQWISTTSMLIQRPAARMRTSLRLGMCLSQLIKKGGPLGIKVTIEPQVGAGDRQPCIKVERNGVITYIDVVVASPVSDAALRGGSAERE